jgi:hypothetical protein
MSRTLPAEYATGRVRAVEDEQLGTGVMTAQLVEIR